MPRKSGRPPKSTCSGTENKQLIIETTIRLIKEQGADYITVRNVCREADIGTGTFYYHFKNKDDLLMYFLRETSFDSFELNTPISDISGRIAELYMHLIRRYMDLGLDFMKSFYSTGNRSLSAYMGEINGKFEPGTVMARSESELRIAKEQGVICKSADIHEICMDICTIVKGCVFEWCLTEGNMDISSALQRIVGNYLNQHLKQ